MDVDLNYSGKDICGSREKQASYSFSKTTISFPPAAQKIPGGYFFLFYYFIHPL